MKSTPEDRRAFLTGSRAYGIAGPDSDIDLVVFVTREELEKLRELGKEDNSEDENYIKAGGVSLRFGRLNLICVHGEQMYKVWREGTARLKKQKPVTREFACKLLKRLREEAGLCSEGD